MDLTPAQDRCVHCAELGHTDCVRGAYRFGVLTGREDAARAAEAVFPTSTDTMRAFLARHRLSDTPSVGAVSVALLADVREAISLGRSAGGVGDNPEEQRP